MEPPGSSLPPPAAQLSSVTHGLLIGPGGSVFVSPLVQFSMSPDNAIGIDVHHQLADLAAGSGGRHLKKSEGHPRNAPAYHRRQGPRSGPA
jgi:hypothetical protein